MSSSVEAKLDRARRKMENLCVIIEKLFNARPRPSVCLKQHIAQLEETIAMLPEHKMADRLVGTFRNKVIRFWQLFECGQVSQLDDTNGFSQRPAYDVHRRDGSDFEPLPSPDVVRCKLKAAFERLDKVKSLETDFEGMKNLLVLVTKARAITMQYWKNVQLLSDIFSFAFVKLPDLQQELYDKEYNGKKKWLRDLRLFIQEEIDLFVCMKQENQAVYVAAAGDALKKRNRNVCFYCKISGHIAANCPVLVSTYCCRCNRFGHTDFRCPNEMVYIRLDDI